MQACTCRDRCRCDGLKSKSMAFPVGLSRSRNPPDRIGNVNVHVLVLANVKTIVYKSNRAIRAMHMLVPQYACLVLLHSGSAIDVHKHSPTRRTGLGAAQTRTSALPDVLNAVNSL